MMAQRRQRADPPDASVHRLIGGLVVWTDWWSFRFSTTRLQLCHREDPWQPGPCLACHWPSWLDFGLSVAGAVKSQSWSHMNLTMIEYGEAGDFDPDCCIHSFLYPTLQPSFHMGYSRCRFACPNLFGGPGSHQREQHPRGTLARSLEISITSRHHAIPVSSCHLSLYFSGYTVFCRCPRVVSQNSIQLHTITAFELLYFVANLTSTLESSQVPTMTEMTLPKMTKGFRRLAMNE